MTTLLKKVALAAALATASLSAHAAEVDIAVWADIDPALSMMKADGSALDSSVKLSHDAGTGLLATWKQRVRIHSNDVDKDITVRLGASPSLIPEGSAGGTAVPLAVTLNGEALSTTAKDFEASNIFDGALPGRSIPMDLTIGQGNTTAIATAGRYNGLVTLVLLQKP